MTKTQELVEANEPELCHSDHHEVAGVGGEVLYSKVDQRNVVYAECQVTLREHVLISKDYQQSYHPLLN